MADKPESTEAIRRLTVQIPDELHHRLQLQAVDQRTTMTAVLCEILDRALPPLRKRRTA